MIEFQKHFKDATPNENLCALCKLPIGLESYTIYGKDNRRYVHTTIRNSTTSALNSTSCYMDYEQSSRIIFFEKD